METQDVENREGGFSKRKSFLVRQLNRWQITALVYLILQNSRQKAPIFRRGEEKRRDKQQGN